MNTTPPPGPEADANAADPDANLPDAPLFALLRTMAERVGVERIDRVWLFPPRRLKAGETSVVVLAAFHDLDDDRRRVYAGHYTAPAEPAAEPRLAIDEFGAAPADRLGRVVEEVVERIKDDAPQGAPRAVQIQGDDGRWHTMLHELAEEFLEASARDPRLPGGR